MQVTVEQPKPGAFVLMPHGELDMASAPALDEAVAEVMGSDTVTAMIVDLSGVGFLDSSGIRALLQARRAVTDLDAEFSLANPSEQVALVLRAAALHHVFEIGGEDRPPLEV